uniref:Uncharacterized protein n=1 Tax=Oryzias sinensis TaxID=183150 RepID=A0A8C7X8D0_9TELE
MKTLDFNSLVFVWLLPLAASEALTTGWHNMVTDYSTNQSQPTTHTPVSLTPTNPLEKKSPPSLQSVTTPESTRPSAPESTRPSAPESTRPSTPDSSTSHESSGSLKPETASTAALSSSLPPTAPPMQSTSTNTQDAETSPTSQISTSNTTSSRTPLSEIFTSHLTTSVKTEDSNSTSTQATASTKTLLPYRTTTFRSSSQTTKRAKLQEKKESNSGQIVAGLIGGALALMMAGFLAIYIKKRRIQKQQTMVTDWAGPSPFLQDEGDGGQVTKRPANRISIASFLPHRLSKRLSLLHDMDQELKDMAPAVTFGHEVQVKDAKDSNSLSASDAKSLSEAGGPTESPPSVVSSKSDKAAPEDQADDPATSANA